MPRTNTWIYDRNVLYGGYELDRYLCPHCKNYHYTLPDKLPRLNFCWYCLEPVEITTQVYDGYSGEY